MVNYANGKIYKIESNIGDKIYIGSTTKTQLSQRMGGHRACYKSWKAGKGRLNTVYHLFDEYGVENCKIVLLEECPCETNDQLKSREAHFIKTLECVNKAIPLRTRAEFYQDNRPKIMERMKANHLENREGRLVKMKEYYVAHRAEISEYQKAYAAANREKIKERERARYHAKKAV
jgi:ribosome-interacting GTPase 1